MKHSVNNYQKPYNTFLLCMFCMLFLIVSSDSKTLSLFSYGQQLQLQSNIESVQNTTYTDPNGNYTLQYPQGWKVEYKEPVIKFVDPVTQFTLPDHKSIITISMGNIEIDEKSFKEGFLIYYPLILQERFNHGLQIVDKILGNYTIDGHTAGSIVFINQVDNSFGVIKGLFITSVFENNKTISITYTSSEKFFDHNMKDIDSMIKSIKINTDRA
ncbi:MAG TPA: hypothetical protein VFG45_00410 [Candidatus Nitrosocosmicus sp.]|nr:hypothetical protein [Candidatus Nitrosocosmicus sp.]